jgi:hypothetical protein
MVKKLEISEAIAKFCEFWSEQVTAIGSSFNDLLHSDGCALQHQIINYLKENWIPKEPNGLTLSKLKEHIEKQIGSYKGLAKNLNVEQLSLASKINTFQYILTILGLG